jgi:hypothetical protein
MVIGWTLASASGFINQAWVAGCGTLLGFLHIWGVAPLISPGPSPTGGWGGCDNIATYSDAPELAGLSSVHGHAAATGNSMQVPRAIKWANVEIASAQGTPRVHIVGPGLDYTSPAADGPSAAGGGDALVSSSAHHVIVGLQNPRPGAYTITPAPGSPALTQVMDSFARPTTVTASVTGHGDNRVLHYDIAKQRSASAEAALRQGDGQRAGQLAEGDPRRVPGRAGQAGGPASELAAASRPHRPHDPAGRTRADGGLERGDLRGPDRRRDRGRRSPPGGRDRTESGCGR